MPIKKNMALISLQLRSCGTTQQLLEIPARTTDEPRYLVIGRIADKHWSGVITYRGDAIRIISVRRARQEEIRLYEGH